MGREEHTRRTTGTEDRHTLRTQCDTRPHPYHRSGTGDGSRLRSFGNSQHWGEGGKGTGTGRPLSLRARRLEQKIGNGKQLTRL